MLYLEREMAPTGGDTPGGGVAGTPEGKPLSDRKGPNLASREFWPLPLFRPPALCAVASPGEGVKTHPTPPGGWGGWGWGGGGGI